MTNEDCISRRAVINAIYANGVWENEYNLTSSRIKKAVEELPSINPQHPKTGHWIKLSVGYGCSECTLATNDYGKNMYSYCPGCGAKMESESSSEKPNKLEKEPKTEKELKQQLFKLMYELDKASVREDYDALRRLHYSGIRWVSDNDLLWEYYKYFSNRSESEG